MHKLLYLSLAVALLIGACDDGVLTFPQPTPATVRFVHVIRDVDSLSCVVAASDSVTISRGKASSLIRCDAGRPVGFVLKNGSTLLRDTLYYTLDGSANVILFARGSASQVVEFRRAIQDTTLPATASPVLRFTHMAEAVNKFFTVEVWVRGGDKLFSEEFDPGFSSSYATLPPGTYSFELREAGTTNVAAVIENVTISAGTSYMLYSWDASSNAEDSVNLSIF